MKHGNNTNNYNLEDVTFALNQHTIIGITDSKGKILHANQNFCRISKYNHTELIGKDHRILNSKYHSKEFFRNLWQTIKSGNIWNGDIRNQAKDGSFYWVNTTIVPILDDNDAPVQYIAIRTLITDRKILEEENTMMIKELKSVNHELTNFAYIVSHDLKAPLRGINSLSQWLLEDYADKLDANGKHYLNLIASRCRNMTDLIDGILTYSRAGQKLENEELVDLNLLIVKIIDMLSAPKNISIEITDTLPTIFMEYYKAQQIFQNLIQNSIKFSDKPIGQIKISAVKDKGNWLFAVTDNGIGIDSKYFDKIFEPFQILNTTDNNLSTGIGLPMIKRIIELYGGSIWLESEVGVGTSFYFKLPINN